MLVLNYLQGFVIVSALLVTALLQLIFDGKPPSPYCLVALPLVMISISIYQKYPYRVKKKQVWILNTPYDGSLSIFANIGKAYSCFCLSNKKRVLRVDRYYLRSFNSTSELGHWVKNLSTRYICIWCISMCSAWFSLEYRELDNFWLETPICAIGLSEKIKWHTEAASWSLVWARIQV